MGQHELCIRHLTRSSHVDHHPFAYILAAAIALGAMTGHLTGQDVQNLGMLVVSLAVSKQGIQRLPEPEQDHEKNDQAA